MTLVKQRDQCWEILEKRAMRMLSFHCLNEDFYGLSLSTSWRANENHRELVDIETNKVNRFYLRAEFFTIPEGTSH